MSPPPESGKVKTAAASANTNVFPESAEVKGITTAVWTQAVHDKWKAKLIADKPS